MLKILWLTPAHQQSAIGKFSKLVTDVLHMRGFNIQVCGAEDEFDAQNLHEFGGSKPRSFSDLSSMMIDDEFDTVVINFGDHYPNHAKGLQAIRHKRVIGIFHDYDMVNYGNGARAFGDKSNVILQDAIEGAQVTSTLASLCDGVVAHSNFYASTLATCDGPLSVIPLAWKLPDDVRNGHQKRNAENGADEVILTTIGNINPNKCADRVIEAIGSDDKLRNTLRYQLIGSISPEEKTRLSGLATDLGVNLSIEGSVEQEVLHQKLATTDIVSCLRNPVLEGASASAIETMLHGCPVLVSDAGFYAELPDNCVYKVPADTKPEAIAEALLNALSQEKERRQVGECARDYAEKVFAPENYAEQLIELINNVRMTSSYNSLIEETAQKIAYYGIEKNSGSVATILKALEQTAPVVQREAE